METNELKQIIAQVVRETLMQMGVAIAEEKPRTTIVSYYEKWINDFERQVKAGMKAESTLRKHRRVLACLREYLIYNKVEDMAFADAGKDFLTNFQIYLKTEKRLATGSIRVYLSPVIMLFRHAHDDGLTGRYLFRDFRFEHEDNDRGFLSKVDLLKLMAYECKSEQDTLVRDLFLFCCFTGLAFADLKGLCGEHVVSNPVDDSLWIQKPRKKTSVKEIVRLLPLPRRIMESHRKQDSKTNVFDFPSYKSCSRIIKRVVKECGITRHVTWHIARHTMATSVCLAHGVTMEAVSRILGHRNMRSTQIYAKVTQDKLSRELDELEARLSAETQDQAM